MAASRPGKSAGNGTTATGAQRRVPRNADSTKTPQHKLPVSGAGPLTLRRRADTTAVTGPSAWENGRDVVTTNPQARLTGARQADVRPDSDGDFDGD